MSDPTPEQAQALQAFANKHGSHWKGMLSRLWLTDPPRTTPHVALLRQVRNQLGPEWLYKRCKIKPENPPCRPNTF